MSTQITGAVWSAIAGPVGNLTRTLLDYSLDLAGSIIFLSRKADEVSEQMEMLQSLRDDIRRTRANVSNELERWMSRVRSLAEDAANFQRSYEHGSTFNTRLRLGYDAVELLKRARKLAEEGNLFSGGAPLLTRPRGPDPVEQLVLPSETSSSTLAGGMEASRQVEGYTVEIVPGDTLWELSRMHGVPIGEIRRANGLTGDTIFAGEYLVIPTSRGRMS